MRPAAAALALTLARPAFAATPELKADVSISSTAAAVPRGPLHFRFGVNEPHGSKSRASIGVSVGLEEGKPLEMGLWGCAGAAVGTMAGPLGVVVGAAVGAVVGFFISPKPLKSRAR